MSNRIDVAREEGIGMQRWWALAAMTLGILAVGLDVTVLSVALPTLAAALHAAESDLQWFSAAYALALAACMLPAGLLGDRLGRKGVMLASLVLFGVGSLGCAYAPSATAFIAARVTLGLAGAGMVVMALSVMTVLFSEEERPRAVGIWGAANFIALPIGPLLGGWLLSHYWWGWVFLMNVPVAILGLVAVAALVPESRAPVRPGIDLVGIVVSSAGLVGLTYGLIAAGPNGWADVSTLAPLGVGLALLVVFVLWELRQTRLPGGQPLVDLTLFRSASFTWGVTLAALVVVAMFGALFTLPQYFQGVMGVDAQGSGLRLLPVIAGVVLGGLPAYRVRSWIGPKLTVTLGLVVLAVGMLVGARTTVNSGDAFIAAWLLVCGIGMGLALVTAAAAALIEIPAERSGTGSALMQAFQKLGAPFGAAILGSVLSSAYQAQLQLAGLPPALTGVVRGSVFGGLAIAGRLHSAALLASVKESFVHGMDVSLVVCAGIAILGALLALAFLPGRTSAAATQTEPGGTPSDRAIA